MLGRLEDASAAAAAGVDVTTPAHNFVSVKPVLRNKFENPPHESVSTDSQKL